MTPEEAIALAKLTQEMELTRLVVLVSMIATIGFMLVSMLIIRSTYKAGESDNHHITLLIERLGTLSDRLTTLTTSLQQTQESERRSFIQFARRSSKEHQKMVTLFNMLINTLAGQDLLDTGQMNAININSHNPGEIE